MTNKVTQCPKCMTSFRVTDAQLLIADGAVRCGSCLHIFHAPEHWLDDPADKKASTNNALTFEKFSSSTNHQTDLTPVHTYSEDKIFEDISEQPALEETYNSDLRDTGDVFEDFADELGPVDTDNYASAEEQNRKEQTSIENNIERPRAAKANSEERERTTEESVFDENILEQAMSGSELFDDPVFEDSIFDDDEPVDGQLSEGSFGTNVLDMDKRANDYTSDNDQYSDAFFALDNPKSLLSSNASQPAHDVLRNNEEPDEYWTELPTTSADIDTDDIASVDTGVSDDVNTVPSIEDPRPEQNTPSLSAPTPAEERDSVHRERIIAGDRIGHNANPLLSNIEPEPVEIATQKTTSRWISRSWMTSIVLALAVLLAQYVFFNFDRFARDESIRPLLNSICNFAGCSVPELTNIRLIQSSNLVIRSHPKIANALIVDAIITNRAHFTQDFPIIELQFTDLDENIIASRRFFPEEYVRGELIGNNVIPSKQPIYISLEIVDPGLEAVSYQLLMHSRGKR